MPTRRMAMTMIGAAALSVAPLRAIWPAWAQSGEQAVTFVKKTSDQLVTIVTAAGSPQETLRGLKEVLDAAVDIDDIARFCLGRFWLIATPDQQKRYMALFHELLVSKIAGHLGEYQGVRVTMGLARTGLDTEIVITTIERPNTPDSQIDWVVSIASGGPKIVDLLSEGTSLRLGLSEEFASYLAHHQYNVDALIEAMRQMLAQNG